jgi:hypothetical protein
MDLASRSDGRNSKYMQNFHWGNLLKKWSHRRLGRDWRVILNAVNSEEMILCQVPSALSSVTRTVRRALSWSVLWIPKEKCEVFLVITCILVAIVAEDGCLFHYLLTVVVVSVTFVFVTLCSTMTSVQSVWSVWTQCRQDFVYVLRGSVFGFSWLQFKWNWNLFNSVNVFVCQLWCQYVVKYFNVWGEFDVQWSWFFFL